MSSSASARLRRVLSNPFAGFAPWILMSVLEGPDRLVLAAAAACLLAVLMGVAGAALGMSPKILDIAGILFFAVLIALASVLGPSDRHWLELWSGEISNGVIALVALGSIVCRTPFTIQYARQDVDRQYWSSPLFLRINNRITLAWTAAFALIAVVGYIGDGPLHQPDNIWTNWIIQLGVVIMALRFTDWYPEYATARFDAPQDPAPSVRQVAGTLLRPLAAYLMPAGIAVLIVSGDPWWVGAGLIAAGVLCERRLRHTSAAATTSSGADSGPATGGPAPAAAPVADPEPLSIPPAA